MNGALHAIRWLKLFLVVCFLIFSHLFFKKLGKQSQNKLEMLPALVAEWFKYKKGSSGV